MPRESTVANKLGWYDQLIGSVLWLIIGFFASTCLALGGPPVTLAILAALALAVSFLTAAYMCGASLGKISAAAITACTVLGRSFVNLGVVAFTLFVLIAGRVLQTVFPSKPLWIQHHLDAVRARPVFHRAIIDSQQSGYGDRGRRFYTIGILVLLPTWFFGTIVAYYFNLHTIGISHRLFESIYRTVLTLGGTDKLRSVVLQGYPASNALAAMRWFGLILPFFIGVPPFFRWLIRINERMSAEHALSKHYVILGFGQVGAALARDILTNGHEDDRHASNRPSAVVIVENGARADELAAIRRLGALVIEQSAEDQEVLERVGAHRAWGVLVATGASSRNIDIAGQLARDIAKKRQTYGTDQKSRRDKKRQTYETDQEPRPKPPRLVPHIAERRLMDWVASCTGDQWRVGATDENGDAKEPQRPRIWPFSADQTAVRRILAHRPISEYARLRPVRRPHIVILGFDSVADWLLPKLFQAARTTDLDPPRVTVVIDSQGRYQQVDVPRSAHAIDPFQGDAGGYLSDLKKHLQLDLNIQEYNFDQLDRSLLEQVTPVNNITTVFGQRLTGEKPPTTGQPEKLQETAIQSTQDPVTTVFVCFGDDRRNLDVALQLRNLVNATRLWRAPVFVRLFEASGLEDILVRTEHELDLHQIVDDFGQDEKTCTRREIFDPPRDHAAQEAHRLYQLGVGLDDLAKLIRRSPSENIFRDNLAGKRLEILKGASKPFKSVRENNPIWIRQWLLLHWNSSRGRLNSTIRELIKQLIPPDEDKNKLPADKDWQKLDFEFLVSNRDQVDHLPEKLRSLGFRACVRPNAGQHEANRLRGPWPVHNSQEESALMFDNARFGQSPHDFPDRIKQTAEFEHDRWLVEKLTMGWRYGPERDETRKRHPLLRPYKHLDPTNENKDYIAAVNIHSILAAGSSSRDWHPEVAIGVIESEELRKTCNDASNTGWLDQAVQYVMSAITHCELVALQETYLQMYGARSKSSTDGDGAENSGGFGGVLAVCAVADVDDSNDCNDNDETTNNQRIFRKLVVEKIRDWSRPTPANSPSGAETNRHGNPFRLISPHVRGIPPEGMRDLAKDPDDDKDLASDWWSVDLLPDGLPAVIAKFPAKLEWPPNRPDGRPPEANSKEDGERELVNDQREHFYYQFLRHRVTAYITERSDWLVLFSSAGYDGTEKQDATDRIQSARRWRMQKENVPTWATSLPDGRFQPRFNRPVVNDGPSDWAFQKGEDGVVRRILNIGDPTPVQRIELDYRNRLVEVVIDPHAIQQNEAESTHVDLASE